jgi:hypothetical protein
MKIWGKQFGGKNVLVYCDNEASVKVLNSGFTKDEFMQCCLRESCFIAATREFEIRAKHIAGKENRIADYLSRWNLDKKYRQLFEKSVNLRNFQEIKIFQVF